MRLADKAGCQKPLILTLLAVALLSMPMPCNAACSDEFGIETSTTPESVTPENLMHGLQIAAEIEVKHLGEGSIRISRQPEIKVRDGGLSGYYERSYSSWSDDFRRAEMLLDFKRVASYDIERIARLTVPFIVTLDYDADGESRSADACFNIELDISRVDVLADMQRKNLERLEKQVGDVDSILKPLEIISSLTAASCSNAKANYEGYRALARVACSQSMLPEPEKKTAISIANGGDAVCSQNCLACTDMIRRMRSAEATMTKICSKIECSPAPTLMKHIKSYSDEITGNACPEEFEEARESEACKAEFNRLYDYCALIDEWGLASNGKTASGLFCSRSSETILLNPDDDISMSLQCICLPAITDYVRLWRDVLEERKECQEKAAEQSEPENMVKCADKTSQIVCDLIFDSIFCNIEKEAQQEDPLEEFISTYTKLDFDKSKLVHSMCSGAFTKEWGVGK
ncbi:hypothetical protein COT48_01140 [Candidatus Woesearchaeota archaeon CG08_land_8_20_14_0_20_47_9]|nr:MAG: hypothetical protein AUJ69_00630 [Candidatus Woesearchaeota archaeon CG1_02_47_18]PIO04298.1 MAG: hypothetical protein COT48_01140 [Candidatus Woesearchaeota archaeon CG08_land_8_20_14_0_20_47_9]